jgi:hypothetical protein
MATYITVNISRDSIDPQGIGSDEDYESAVERIMDDVREAFPDADIRSVGNGGSTSGVTDDGRDITDEVKQIVNDAFDSWCASH